MKRTPLKRGQPIRRTGRVKPVNAKRKRSEFARCYHSKERVAWVKALGCACGCGGTPCDNAHAIGGGAGRKAGYETILPLARGCHLAQHRSGWEAIGMTRDKALAAAEQVQRMWERYAEGE